MHSPCVSVRQKIFKIRVGVALESFILLMLSVALNLEFFREDGTIQFLDDDFVLVVCLLFMDDGDS